MTTFNVTQTHVDGQGIAELWAHVDSERVKGEHIGYIATVWTVNGSFELGHVSFTSEIEPEDFWMDAFAVQAQARVALATVFGPAAQHLTFSSSAAHEEGWMF